ncbi:tetratricopeptide repeat protein [Acinetobacter sp. YH12027]|uniref:tetratricopeptide repeat protein n=1 Tax=Acinetobacter sp. YH12027 TaxID=2601043 RepID=UPI0015D31B48|nr:tetratricopeptide repeat protein [Acinetobacter sp. YH12027]
MSELSISPALYNRAMAGNKDAQFELAEIYMQSENDEHVELAEEWALKAAQLGHVEAMYWLGEGYAVYAKDMLEEDPEESKTYFEHAHRWLEQAAKHDHPAAILELANFYRRGDVVEKDITKSIELVEQSAKLGEVQAMRDLAFIYANGLGIDADEEKADFWNEKANVAEQPKA